MITLMRMRTLTLEQPSHPGRPAHVSAASGLARAGDRLYVVADDENHLGVFPASGTGPGSLARLLEETLPTDAGPRKRHKPDFESLVRLPARPGYPNGVLLALGSCSKPNRCRGILAGLDCAGRLDGSRREIDMAPLREALESSFGQLNIEGALALGEELLLLQRGNKGDRRNARIRLRLDRAMAVLAEDARLDAESLVGVDEVELGTIGDVPLCFTDGASLPDGRVVFTAVAEDTGDSYEDGACRGAAIGVLSRRGRLDRLEPIDPPYKVEGIEAWLADGAIHALLVSDGDDPEVPASLLRGAIPD